MNFLEADDGYLYGHFETIKDDVDRDVKIERLGTSTSANYIDGVDVVWTATVDGWIRAASLDGTKMHWFIVSECGSMAFMPPVSTNTTKH